MFLLFLALLHNSLTSSDIRTLSCSKPANQVANGIIGVYMPESETCDVFETYSLNCIGEYSLGLGEESVMTCQVSGDGTTAVLSPASLQVCSKKKTKQSEFANQIAATPASYAVDSDYGCVVEGYDPETQKTIYNVEDCAATSLVTQIDLGCKTKSNVLIGYPALMVFDWSGDFGEDILQSKSDDDNLKIKVGCEADSTTVCKNVHTSNAASLSSSKLYVDIKATPKVNIEQTMMIQEGDSSVKYKFRCADGFNFKSTVDDSKVYGYCTKSGADDSTKNEYKVTEPNESDELECFSVCSANPGAESFTDTSVDVEKIYVPEMRKGQTEDVLPDYVICPSEESLAADAPDKFKITCDGAATTEDARSGKLSCDPCPKCYKSCPANPIAENIQDGNKEAVEKLKSIVIADASKHHKVVTVAAAGVTCDEDYSLAEDAAASYQITCGTGTEGLYTCTNTNCPTCAKMCPIDPETANIDISGGTGNVKSLKINASSKLNKKLTVKKEDVVCTDGYALDAEAPPEFQFTCGENGVYTCTSCPMCKGNCKWPDLTAEGIKFEYVDEAKNPPQGDASPGSGHIVAYCTNTTLNIIGPRFLSCSKTDQSSDVDITFDVQGFANTTTSCQETAVCAVPVLTEATADKTGNILVGETYLVTCNQNRMFDLVTKKKQDSYVEAEVNCTAPVGDATLNDKLPPVSCYDGCKPISIEEGAFNGTMSPAVVEEGQAPYSNGTVITFTCPQGFHLDKDDKQQTCKDGKITKIPSCQKTPDPTERPQPVTDKNHATRTLISIYFLISLQLCLVAGCCDP